MCQHLTVVSEAESESQDLNRILVKDITTRSLLRSLYLE